MKSFFILLNLFATLPFLAQPTLQPSIGIGALPNDNDTICAFPTFTGNFDAVGYAIGDTVPDFTLYTTNGTPVNLQTVLAQGKPVLLIGGNLTCPVFRNKIATINNMATIYNGLLEIYIIYGMEAHPTSPSPYSGTIWITNSNQQAGILHPQPTTYGARKALIDTLLTTETILPPILVDGVCNEWLSHFGPAPNNAYLIDTTGVVYEKQGWFHKLPDDMYCEIDSLLGTTNGLCNATGNNGLFTFAYVNDTIEYGAAGTILGVEATLNNVSATDNVVIDIIRRFVNVPQNWQTAICVDICLPPTTDTTQVTIPPGMTQDFTFYFYTAPTIDSFGFAQLGFKNVNNNQNKFLRYFWAETGKTTSSPKVSSAENDLLFYPNPSSGIVYWTGTKTVEGSIQIIDSKGVKVKHFTPKVWQDQQILNLSMLPRGLYFLQLSSKKGQITKKIILR
ncbi:T9SS type A sorting domain-containing protein [Aureispira anguillae]|uniref:T9SS type A sorting domain-containing protein n=1 Tax=Aureispira anguillae TaxID=2864201 RepID=A0A915YEP3_9BACT|nr:T9SS type A sorting domain-containing protein [Aureispira anguillae]BDS11753.1 T9SS type A sorting domain-containing protein [Aureispira anguillae]